MLGLASDAARLRRVLLRSGQHDRGRARQRLERALAAVDWVPPGLGPESLLVVRRLAAEAGVPAAAAAAAPLHERVSQALRRHATRARRPWIDANAATAEAVLFLDEAELLACLVRDWLRGSISAHWWWRGVLGGEDTRDWLRRHVAQRGDVLVSAIGLLAEGGDALAWLAQWESAAAEEALAVVAREHAVSLVVPPPAPAVRERPAQVDESQAERRHLRRHVAAERAALERLLVTVPEIRAPVLGPAQRRLLALALALVRTPGWARTLPLATALRALESDELPVQETLEAIRFASIGKDDRPATHAADPLPAGRVAARYAAPSDGADHVVAPLPDERIPGGAPADAVLAAAVDSVDAPHSRSLGQIITETGSAEAETLHAPPRRRAAEAPTAPASPPMPMPIPRSWPSLAAPRIAESQPVAIDLAVRIPTQFGGLFYLLNVALALGLYADFTAPRTPGLALSPWDWLALLGRAWFGAELERDPLWRLLAELTGRGVDDAPGRDFEAPIDWRIDPAWLTPWADAAAPREAPTCRRLRALHPAGFAVLDVARERPRRRPPRRRATNRWLRWLLDYLRARLLLALDADPAADVPSFVCRQAATVAVTPAAVTVELSLADLPLAIRVAGLDRDPGWIPAAGRSLAFRFQ